MRIRTTLILIGLFGNVVLALSLIFLYGYRENIQRSYSSESLVSTYESAWFQTLETSFDAISAWLPQTGERGNFWDPETEIFPEEELSSPDAIKRSIFFKFDHKYSKKNHLDLINHPTLEFNKIDNEINK